MAVTKKESVIRSDADTDTTTTQTQQIVGIKVIATAASTVRIRSGSQVSDPVIWEESLAAAGTAYNQVSIISKEGLYFETTGSPVVYIYTK